MPTSTTERLAALREHLRKHELLGYIVPSGDAHQSEYIADCDARRAFISGFDGSAGTAVVGLSSAGLWTDGRYFLQASQQMDENWTLMKEQQPGTPTISEWLETLSSGSEFCKVGVDPKLVSERRWLDLSSKLAEKNLELVAIDQNLIDLVWTGRPAAPMGQVLVLNESFSGRSVEDKLAELRASLATQDADGLVLSALDEIAWLLNIRGSDVPYNPVVISYVLVTADEVLLFIDSAKIGDEVRKHLAGISGGVKVRPYDDIFSILEHTDKRIGLDADGHSHALFSAARKGATSEKERIVSITNPIVLAKALKNSVEQEGFRKSHIRDGAALVRYFAWLEDQLVNQKTSGLNEVAAADKLEELRSQGEHFMGLSFPTISGSGPNGAIIHYRPESSTAAPVNTELLYLCDSGAQYKDGTTDVTRTLHFGEPSSHQKRTFTRVLQGHIALARAVFPEGTFGHSLDILARIPLWSEGLNYRHGTGHGVGHFLNVHEGPHGIGSRATTAPLHAGMTVTNEPGYYEDGEFGIRIENVMLVQKINTPHNFGGLTYLGFETITMAPIQTKLIEKSLLSPAELEWINNYHKEVEEKLTPLLRNDPVALDYLRRNTKPL